MAECRLCGASGDTARFYTSNQSKCAECVKASVRARYQEKREEILAYDQLRANLPHRVAARGAYLKSLPAEKRAEYQRRTRAKYPERSRARNILLRYLKAGKITRPTQCEVCREQRPLHGHHDDYAAPLNVRWLCTTCHRQAHEQIAGWGRRISNTNF